MSAEDRIALSLRLPPKEIRRLDDFVKKYPVVRDRHSLVRRAILIGISVLEADPSALLREPQGELKK